MLRRKPLTYCSLVLVYEPPKRVLYRISDFHLKQTVPISGPGCPGLHHWVSGGWVGSLLASSLGPQHSPSSCSGAAAQTVEGCAERIWSWRGELPASLILCQRPKRAASWHQQSQTSRHQAPEDDPPMDWEDGFGMIQVRYMYCGLYYYRVSFTSDHQALDPRGGGPLC